MVTLGAPPMPPGVETVLTNVATWGCPPAAGAV